MLKAIDVGSIDWNSWQDIKNNADEIMPIDFIFFTTK